MDSAGQLLLAEQKPTTGRGRSRASMEKLGIQVSRYGLAVTLLLIGVLKFTGGEAEGIQPLVANSPLTSGCIESSAFRAFPI